MLKLLLFLNDIGNQRYIGYNGKNTTICLKNIVKIQFYNTYYNSRTKIEKILFRLPKLRLSHVRHRQNMRI